MDCQKVGGVIKSLRKEKGLNQSQLAGLLRLSGKTVSKWENGRGCPDVSLLPELSRILGANLEEVLSGELKERRADSGNLRRAKFYRCEKCGNAGLMTGGTEIFCCGRKLEPLLAKKQDAAHAAEVSDVDGELYITFGHEMTKAHSICFAALVACERVLFVRLYPEQSGEVRIPKLRGPIRLYLCCTDHGLYEL